VWEVEGRDGARKTDGDRPERREGKEKKRSEEKKPAQPAPAAASGEPMIIVYVNDRLGTKAAIPCLASDPISRFFWSSTPYVTAVGHQVRMAADRSTQDSSKPRSPAASDVSRTRSC